MNAIAIDAPKPTLATLPAELLHAILCNFAVPGIAQLYELRIVCRSVGAAASRAFLAKIRNLFVVNRDRSPAFAVAVKAIQAKGEGRLRAFSLGRLLRAIGLPSDSPFVPQLLDALYWDQPHVGPFGDFLSGLGSSPLDILDTLWTLYRCLPSFPKDKIYEVLRRAFLDRESTPEVASALLNSPFPDEIKLPPVFWRYRYINDEELTVQAAFDLILGEARRRFPDDNESVLQMLTSQLC